MSWLWTALVFVAIAVATAYFFPETSKEILKWINRARTGVFAILIVISAFYFLTTGVWLLVILGGLILIVGIWQFMFDNPFDWLQ
jgi:hypothetical protein